MPHGLRKIFPDLFVIYHDAFVVGAEKADQLFLERGFIEMALSGIPWIWS